MKLKTVAAAIRELKGAMPESFRTLVAHRLFNAFVNSLPYTDRNTENEATMAEAFHTAAGINSDLPFVSHDLQIHDSDLATFCNRWMSIEKYKNESQEWKPFTSDMNSVRYTMVKELQKMGQDGKSTPTDSSDNENG